MAALMVQLRMFDAAYFLFILKLQQYLNCVGTVIMTNYVEILTNLYYWWRGHLRGRESSSEFPLHLLMLAEGRYSSNVSFVRVAIVER